MDNRGNHLIAVDDSAINTPAIGAGHVIKRYAAQAADELSFEVRFRGAPSVFKEPRFRISRCAVVAALGRTQPCLTFSSVVSLASIWLLR